MKIVFDRAVLYVHRISYLGWSVLCERSGRWWARDKCTSGLLLCRTKACPFGRVDTNWLFLVFYRLRSAYSGGVSAIGQTYRIVILFDRFWGKTSTVRECVHHLCLPVCEYGGGFMWVGWCECVRWCKCVCVCVWWVHVCVCVCGGCMCVGWCVCGMV